MSSKLETEPRRRRTFAIISHPDAGKTTLTENILLAGGAIHLAGEVAARGRRRRTRSDWMKIERDRGISVSASVMTFEYNGQIFNILDTPGHEDFSEDTYRTLTAADSAIMVLDAARGIEPQTLKLFEVCRMRNIPIITFINKMDREAQDPFDLLDEIQNKLQLDTAPLYWPAASGNRFAGMLKISDDSFIAYQRRSVSDENRTPSKSIEDVDEEIVSELKEGVQLCRELLPKFDQTAFVQGHLTPIVFGSALNRFGIPELLNLITTIAPSPTEKTAVKKARDYSVRPSDAEVSGFVFKIQANMDPNHRDRIAFFRICSGEFYRGIRLRTTNGKQINVHNPMMFLAQDREVAEQAYAGDVVGISNHGQLRVGDALSQSGDIKYEGIPNFAPELLRRVRTKDPMKTKHLRKALTSLAEEGVTQLFQTEIGSELIVGAVGVLQIDVMKERLVAEYGLEVEFETPSVSLARWLSCDDETKLKQFTERNRSASARDLDGVPVFLAKNAWEVGYISDKHPDIRFSTSRERTS